MSRSDKILRTLFITMLTVIQFEPNVEETPHKQLKHLQRVSWTPPPCVVLANSFSLNSYHNQN